MKRGRLVKGIGGHYFLSKWKDLPSGGVEVTDERSRWDVSVDVRIIEQAAIKATLNALIGVAPNPETAEWLRGQEVGPQGAAVAWDTPDKRIEAQRTVEVEG